MSFPDLLRLIVVVIGILGGYGFGRLLWIRRRVALSFWLIILVLAGIGLATERLFQAANLAGLWQAAFFPLIVGIGVGVAITTARPPHRAAWWELWKV